MGKKPSDRTADDGPSQAASGADKGIERIAVEGGDEGDHKDDGDAATAVCKDLLEVRFLLEFVGHRLHGVQSPETKYLIG